MMLTRVLYPTLMLLLVAACQPPAEPDALPPATTAPAATPATTAQADAEPTASKERPVAELPPGFMDEPPPPPTSNTLVLSGGMLLMDDQWLADSVVVVTDGMLRGWGKRGEVAMPHDSIGRDLRGKWLQPLAALEENTAANLDIFDTKPTADARPSGQIRGTDVVLPVVNQ